MKSNMTIPTTIIVTQSGGRFLVIIGEILGDTILCNGVVPAKSPYMLQSVLGREDVLDHTKCTGYVHLDNFHFNPFQFGKSVTYNKPTFREVMLWRYYMARFKRMEDWSYKRKYIRV